MQDADQPDRPPQLVFDRRRRRRLTLSRLSSSLKTAFRGKGEPVPPEFDDLLEQIDYWAARRPRDRR